MSAAQPTTLVVNNARFLILPWIRIPNLASHILARCEKQLLQDCRQLDSCRSHHGAREMFSQFQTDTAGQGHLALSIESGLQAATDTLTCSLRGEHGICVVCPVVYNPHAQPK